MRLLRPRLRVRLHEAGNPGNDLFSEPGSVEDPEVSDRGALEVVLAIGRDARAELKGCAALTRPGDVVLLAFDGHERRTPYLGEPNGSVVRSHGSARK